MEWNRMEGNSNTRKPPFSVPIVFEGNTPDCLRTISGWKTSFLTETVAKLDEFNLSWTIRNSPNLLLSQLDIVLFICCNGSSFISRVSKFGMSVGSEKNTRFSKSTFSSNSMLSINSNVYCNSVFSLRKIILDAPEK